MCQIITKDSGQIGICLTICPYVKNRVSLSAFCHTDGQKVLKEQSFVCTVNGGGIGIGSGVICGVIYGRVIDCRFGSRLRSLHRRLCWDSGQRHRRRQSRRWHGFLRCVIRAYSVFMQMRRVAMMIVIRAETAGVLIIMVSAAGIRSAGMCGCGEKRAGRRKGAGSDK